MRPLPTTTQVAPVVAKPPVPTATQTLELGPLSHSSSLANRRSAGSNPKSYPWLLLASTGLAAVFCGLYLTKPVIAAAPSRMAVDEPFDPAPPLPPGPAMAMAKQAAAVAPSLLPSGATLPGDHAAKPQTTDPRHLESVAPGAAASYEETNLRIQHVLKARGPAGEDLGKIMLEVPVLYGSRSLRWTPAEIARARELLVRMGDYQEKSRALQNECSNLLSEWNSLVGDSIPTSVLRADSPSLTREALLNPGEGLDSTEAIEIQNR